MKEETNYKIAVSYKNKIYFVKRKDLFNIETECQNCSFNADLVPVRGFIDCHRNNSLIQEESENYLKDVVQASKFHANRCGHKVDIKMAFPKINKTIKPNLFCRLKHFLVELYWLCS